MTCSIQGTARSGSFTSGCFQPKSITLLSQSKVAAAATTATATATTVMMVTGLSSMSTLCSHQACLPQHHPPRLQAQGRLRVPVARSLMPTLTTPRCPPRRPLHPSGILARVGFVSLCFALTITTTTKLSLSLSLTHSLTHPFTLTHSLLQSFTPSPTHSLLYSFTLSLSPSPSHTHTLSLTCDMEMQGQPSRPKAMNASTQTH